jgi:hypothetical protein
LEQKNPITKTGIANSPTLLRIHLLQTTFEIGLNPDFAEKKRKLISLTPRSIRRTPLRRP